LTQIALLDADPDLADAVEPDDLRHARAALVAPAIELETGAWDPNRHPDAAMGLLVLDGALLREVVAGEAAAMELLGPGDLVVPGADEVAGAFVDAEARWTALLPAQLAVLRPELVQRLSDWPGVLGVVVRRMAERSARQSVMQAICHTPRVDARLRGLFWHLADRWGRVTPAGVVLPLRLTHDALARLVGAQRPTVSTALKSLSQAGEVMRRRDGSWLLLPESQERMERLQRRAASMQTALELIPEREDADTTLREQVARLRIASEEHSASFVQLRRRIATLRAETADLASQLRRLRSNGPEEDAERSAS